MRRARQTGQRGFTLVELMMVVAIIGLVASFALPSLAETRRAANDTAAYNMLRAVHDAQQHYSRMGHHPNQPGAFAQSMAHLFEVGLLPAQLTLNGELFADAGGFRFMTIPGPPFSAGADMRVTCVPLNLKAGNNSYLMIESGAIFVAEGQVPFFFDESVGRPLSQ